MISTSHNHDSDIFNYNGVYFINYYLYIELVTTTINEEIQMPSSLAQQFAASCQMILGAMSCLTSTISVVVLVIIN